jgi:hypothetical protein
MRRSISNVLLFLALFTTACGEESDPEEFGERDSAVDPLTTLDSSTADAGSSDAGKPLDGALLQDSGALDSGALDSGAPDSSTLDSSVIDAGATLGADGSTQDASSDGSVPKDAAVAATTFTRVHEILKANCMNCHTTNSQGMLNFSGSKAATHGALVGVRAKGGACGGADTNRTRVVEGSPDTSLLMVKLEGGPNLCGERMPKQGLSSALIAEIRSWIAAGALDN